MSGLLHELLEARHLQRDAPFAAEKLGKIHREAKGIIKLEGGLGGEGFVGESGGFFLKQGEAPVEGFVEAALLTLQGFYYDRLPSLELWKGPLHLVHEGLYQCGQDKFISSEAQRPAVSYRTPQDAPQDIIAPGVARKNPICNREAERAKMIGDNPECHCCLHGFVRSVLVRTGINVLIGFSAQLLEGIEDGPEDIGVVVRGLAREIREAICVLDNRTGTFESHAGIDMFGGKVPKAPICLGIELDEDEIPDLDALITILVHQQAPGISLRGEVHMQFGARPAGARLSHHPEVIGLVAIDDMDFGVTAGLFEQGFPVVVGFLVKVGWVIRARAINGGVKALGGKAPSLNHELPCPGDGVLLEIIPEGPVPQHLEKGVVVGILAHILEVVVLTSRPDALLGVGGPGRGVGRFFRAEKVGNELVHPRIGEEQSGGLREERRGWHNGVPLLFKEVQKALANFRGGHGAVIWSGIRSGWQGRR